MESIDNLPEFVWAVAHFWATLMTGGIAALVLGIIERRRGQLAWGRYLLILAFALFMACYSAWDRERTNVMRMAEQLACLERLHAEQSDRSSIRRTLLSFFPQASKIMERRFPTGTKEDDPEFRSYVNEATNWATETSDWINGHIGEAARAKFLNESKPSLVYPWAVNAMQQHMADYVAILQGNLEEIIRSPAWDTPKANTESGPECAHRG